MQTHDKLWENIWFKKNWEILVQINAITQSCNIGTYSSPRLKKSYTEIKEIDIFY